MESYGVNLPDNILNHLFSKPYLEIDIRKISPELSDYKNRIISGFKVVATSHKTSIPVSFFYNKEDYYDNPQKLTPTDYLEQELEQKLKEMKDQITRIRDEFYNDIAPKIFSSDTGIYDILGLVEELIMKVYNLDMSKSGDNYVKGIMLFAENINIQDSNVQQAFLGRYKYTLRPKVKINEDAFNSLKDKIKNNRDQAAKLKADYDAIKDQMNKLSFNAEYEKRKKYVGKIRNRKSY
jgi:F0F1-type ATP synthase membrane subunit b/b'